MGARAAAKIRPQEYTGQSDDLLSLLPVNILVLHDVARKFITI